MAIAGIDFVKNIMIAAQCYVGTLMDPASAKLLAYTLLGMCLGGLVNLFANPVFPPGSNMPPLPPVIYLTIVPTIYIYAILTDTAKPKKKSSGGFFSKLFKSSSEKALPKESIGTL